MKNLNRFIFSLCLFAWSFAVFAQSNTELPIYTEDKPSIMVTADKPEFVIKLKSNPTTGYSWFLKEYRSRYLQPVNHHYQAPENRKLIGAPGHEVWTFRLKPEAFTVPMQTTLKFIYVRPWEKSEPASVVVFSVSTRGK